MNIIETNIPDVTESNISENKEVIADSIIENVYPLFDEVYQAKSAQVFDLKNRIKTGKNQMKKEKETMQQLMTEYKKEKKIAKILERIDKLVKSGLTYDTAMRHETVILLKIIDKLPENKLDHQLAKTMQILNKRFSQ
jgi:hypothetical protein